VVCPGLRFNKILNGVRSLHFKIGLSTLGVIVLTMGSAILLRGCQKRVTAGDWRLAFGVPKPEEVTIIRSQVDVNRISAERTFYFQVSASKNWVFQLIKELGGRKRVDNIASHSLLINAPRWFPVYGRNPQLVYITCEYEGLTFYIVYEPKNPIAVFIAGGS